MNLDSSNIIRIIGILMLGVICLLLGMHLDLNRRIALGDQYQRHHEAITHNVKSRMQNEIYVSRMIKSWEAGVRPRWWSSEFEENAPSYITTADGAMRLDEALISLLDIDNQYYQYRLGLLDESYWQGTREILKGSMRNPFRRAYFLNSARSAEFKSLLEELIGEISESP